MKNKIIKAGLIGRTNAGKSTFINTLIGEKISIENKKINTTQESVAGIINIKKTQIILYDTPGFNFLNKINFSNKENKVSFLENIHSVDLILFIIDISKINISNTIQDINILSKFQKPISIVFNKIDLIKKDLILSYIKKLKDVAIIDQFFSVSSKFNDGIIDISNYLLKKSKFGNWKYSSKIISNKTDIFISNECTRNAILKYIHKEIPYNIVVNNILFKEINKKNIKIKQQIEIKNLRYKSIIIGKNGENIKRIRELSQKYIENILNSKIHLYIEVKYLNAK